MVALNVPFVLFFLFFFFFSRTVDRVRRRRVTGLRKLTWLTVLSIKRIKNGDKTTVSPRIPPPLPLEGKRNSRGEMGGLRSCLMDRDLSVSRSETLKARKNPETFAPFAQLFSSLRNGVHGERGRRRTCIDSDYPFHPRETSSGGER